MSPTGLVDMEVPGTIHALPPEVLAEILKVFGAKKHLSLRLVCKRFRLVLEPFQFKEITISATEKNMDLLSDRLASLVSGETPYALWGKALKLGPMPMLDDPEDETLTLEESMTSQRLISLIIPALRAMPNLDSVSIRFHLHGLLVEVLSVLSQYHNLHQLSITSIGHFQDLRNATFPKMAGLQMLELSDINWGRSSTTYVLTQMVAQMPFLRRLRFSSGSESPGGHVDFVYILGNAQRNGNDSSLNLEGLDLTSNPLRLTPACVPFFRSLRRLVLDDDIEALPSFWISLAEHNVQVEHLVLGDITPPAVGYIHSLQCLRELEFAPPFSYEGLTGKTVISRVLKDVLPYVNDTLQVFRARRGGVLWCACEDDIEQILRCRHLMELQFFFSPRAALSQELPVTALEKFLSSASRDLPYLEKLALMQTGMPDPLLRRGRVNESRRQRWEGTVDLFVRTIQKAVVTSSRPPSFIIKAHDVTPLAAVPGPGDNQYRFFRVLERAM
ncbi:hypothetical protein DFP72DRAFT_443636 [Ephemerocybe angulata]|uniref:F-box domain-containing protein n=1 Tax=Ephemerocybe angulata TaxID=980116 RepID=A0A8H6HTG3_9AGAR|nr:hypothetical protein DFP72DRAFT_443636 [Tulosesus angulatus]